MSENVNDEEKKASEAAAENMAEEAEAVASEAQEAEEASAEETGASEGEEAKVAEAPAEPNYEEQIAQLKDKYLRSLAEFENYRRRMARDFNENREKARQSTVSEFLSVYDYFQMAMAHFENGGNLEALKQGMQMILMEFQKAFDNLGVKQIEAVGKDFDPNFHEAMGREVTTEMEDGKVLRQWKPGFMMGDKLLRAAMVVVAMKPAEAPADVPETEDKSDSDVK